MVHSITGTLREKRGGRAVVAVGGFEFRVAVPVSSEPKLPKTGSKVTLYTFLHVREGGLDLYGFLEEAELEFFEKLLSVSGIGPKSAIGILGVASINQLSAAVSKGEVELLQRSSGIGRKTAERIILELKDKVVATDDEGAVLRMQSDDDVYEALMNLGYPRRQAKDILQKIDPALTSTGDRLRDALKKMKR